MIDAVRPPLGVRKVIPGMEVGEVQGSEWNIAEVCWIVGCVGEGCGTVKEPKAGRSVRAGCCWGRVTQQQAQGGTRPQAGRDPNAGRTQGDWARESEEDCGNVGRTAWQ